MSDLFEPVLDKRLKEPIFSVGALMAAAFFGGAIAVIIVGGANLLRLKSPALHYVYLILSFLIVVGLSLWSVEIYELEDRTRSVVSRLGGFALMGLLYFMHRREYRSMQVLGNDPPSPYVLVITACVIAAVIPTLITRYM